MVQSSTPRTTLSYTLITSIWCRDRDAWLVRDRTPVLYFINDVVASTYYTDNRSLLGLNTLVPGRYEIRTRVPQGSHAPIALSCTQTHTHTHTRSRPHTNARHRCEQTPMATCPNSQRLIFARHCHSLLERKSQCAIDFELWKECLCDSVCNWVCVRVYVWVRWSACVMERGRERERAFNFKRVCKIWKDFDWYVCIRISNFKAARSFQIKRPSLAQRSATLPPVTSFKN